MGKIIYKTFAAEDTDSLEKAINEWTTKKGVTEINRSAPAVAFSPYLPQYEDGGRMVIAVTVTAQY